MRHYYYLLVLKQAFVREPAVTTPVELHWVHRCAVLVPAVLLVVLGLFPGLLLSPVVQAVENTLRGW